MLMLTKTHAAVVAAKDAEHSAAVLSMNDARMAERAHLRRQIKEGEGWLQSTAWELRDAEKRIAVLEARLAVFTAPRARDAKGHFISAKGASAC